MKHLTLASILLLAFSAAFASTSTFYTIGKEKKEFVEDTDKSILASKRCFEKSEKKCEALEILKTITLPKDFAIEGGMNPGSKACDDLAKGSVLIGKDKKQNEQSFCVFEDGSMISTGSLFHYARENANKTK